jgi:hypothetical protein
MSREASTVRQAAGPSTSNHNPFGISGTGSGRIGAVRTAGPTETSWHSPGMRLSCSAWLGFRSAQRVAQQPGVLGRLTRTATLGCRDDLGDLALGAAPRDALDGK